MKRIFLVGYMGSGKTTYGKMLAEKYNLDFKDLDVYIEQRQFKSISQIFKDRGEEGFRKIEHNMLKEVSEFEDVVISAGGGTPCFFDNMEIMNAMGDTVYLEASAEVLFEYLRTAKNERPLLRNKSDEEMLEYIRESLAKRVPFYEKAKYRVDARDVDWSLFEKLLK
ncbi:MAG: shikimate kinase [Paludibacteraceae bacterium]|nr:shikimate kinase [Paludibacteraceae bacterium]